MSNVTLFVQLREEVDYAVDIWSKFLRELGAKYAYVKGSSIKEWDTEIDYVPIISDVDIHYWLDDGLDLNNSLGLPLKYETQFLKKFPNPLHIPRIQLINLTRYTDEEWFVPPLRKQIQLLFGVVDLSKPNNSQSIKSIDLSRLQDLENTLKMIPEMVADRQGIELWIAVRRMSWRVSPTPVRILTQLHENPLEIWAHNRTNIAQLLKKYNFSDFAKLYQAYYRKGWELWHKGLIDTQTSLEMVTIAKDLYIEAIRIVEEDISSLR